MKESTVETVEKKERISAFEPRVLIMGAILAVLSAAICMQIIGKVGVTPNTSLIGAIVAMVVSRIPLGSFKKFRSLERQNLLQTIVSGAGFSAANCGLLSISILYLLGEMDFILPMAIGALFGVCVSIVIVGKLFDSELYPASNPWPPGVATASALEAGDEGGKKGFRLIQGLALGVIGSAFKIPVAGIGIVFIANIFAMAALGIGLLIRGYSKQFTGFDFGTTSIPNGVMIGAGMVALIQSILLITKDNKNKNKEKFVVTVSNASTKKIICTGFALFVLGAFIIALTSGVITKMSIGQLLLWLLWAAFSSTVAMLLVGMAAMHSGWFPAFAITTIFMTIGIFFDFPIVALALLTGYVSSVGPCFADMGYDLKTGWLLRGRGKDVEHELYGRRQQIISEVLGGIIGIAVVLVSMNIFFEADIIPPVSKTFAKTIQASADPALLMQLALWAIPGAIIQVAFGPSKMVGVLFATGLLINNPIYGIGIIVAVIVRCIFGSKFMEIRDAGLIAGDGLFGFFSAIAKVFF